MDMLFESEKQKEATERLLASVRVRTINSEIDAYLNEMLGYAKEIEDLLKRINTRIRLVKTNDALIKEIEESYDVDGSDIDSDLAEANLNFFKKQGVCF